MGFGAIQAGGEDELLSSEDLFSEAHKQDQHLSTSAAGEQGDARSGMSAAHPAPASEAEAAPGSNSSSGGDDGHPQRLSRLPLTGSPLESLVRVLEFMILSSGDLFSP
jgi:hypothetical protein